MLDEKYDPLARKGIAPGTRVLIFDSTLYKDDKETPLSVTVKPATVLCHYGAPAEHYRDSTLGPYGSLVDVQFDHRPERPSRGHFTWGVELIG